MPARSALSAAASPTPRRSTTSSAHASSSAQADRYFYALDGRVDRFADGDHPTTYNVDGTAMTVATNVVVMTARMEAYHLGVTREIGQYLKVRLMDKMAAVSGTLTTWRDIVNVTFPDTTQRAIGVIPVHAISPVPNVFFAQPNGCGFAVWSIADAYPPSEVTSRFAPIASGCVGDYSRQPVDAPQPNGALPLAVSAAGARDFKGTYLDGHLHLVQMSGWSGAVGATNAIRWADVDVRQWPGSASIVQQALITYPAATVFDPALAVNQAGDLALVFGRSSASEPASIWVTSRSSSDPAGTLRSPVLLHGGASSFERDVYGSNRWGDYFGAALDPVDGTLWVSGEYPLARSAAGTWVAQVRVVR